MSAAVFLVFFIQTVNGKYTIYVKEVWQWLFQFITPSITLMVGVLIAQSLAGSTEGKIESFYFRVAFAISLFFLVLLLAAPVIVPFLHLRQNAHLAIEQQHNILQAFKTYDNFLLPVQGLTMLSLGLFFNKK